MRNASEVEQRWTCAEIMAAVPVCKDERGRKSMSIRVHLWLKFF
jgi:hypothetical protein